MRYLCILQLLVAIIMSSCIKTSNGPTQVTWKETLSDMMPLLGHRNWIVMTDMAYPLQTAEGITTLYAPQPFGEVVAFVTDQIKEAKHLSATVYQDSEMRDMTNELSPGFEAYRDSMAETLKGTEVVFMPHEQLIQKLDSASKLFKVVIIKTSLTIPYSSVFFEFGCGYWDDSREQKLRESMNIGQ